MNLLFWRVLVLCSIISFVTTAEGDIELGRLVEVRDFMAEPILDKSMKQKLSRLGAEINGSMKKCIDMIFDEKIDDMKECDYSTLSVGLANFRKAISSIEEMEASTIVNFGFIMDKVKEEEIRMLMQQYQEKISNVLSGLDIHGRMWYRPFVHPFYSSDGMDIYLIQILNDYLASIGFTMLEFDEASKPFLREKYKTFVDAIRHAITLRPGDKHMIVFDAQVCEILEQTSEGYSQFKEMMEKLKRARADLEGASVRLSSDAEKEKIEIVHSKRHLLSGASNVLMGSHKRIFEYSGQRERAQKIQDALKKKLSNIVDESCEERLLIERKLANVGSYIQMCRSCIEENERVREKTENLLRIHIEQPLRQLVEDFGKSFKRLVEGEDGSLAKLLQENKGRLRSEILDESVAYDIYMIYDLIDELSLVCDMIKDGIKPASDAVFLDDNICRGIFQSEKGSDLFRDIGCDYNLLRQVKIALKYDKSCDDSSKKIIKKSVAVMKMVYGIMLRFMKGSHALWKPLSSIEFEGALMNSISRLEALEGLKSVASLDVVSKTVTIASKTMLKKEQTWGGGAVNVETSEMIIGNIVHRARCCKKLFQFLIELKRATTSPVDLEMEIKV